MGIKLTSEEMKKNLDGLLSDSQIEGIYNGVVENALGAVKNSIHCVLENVENTKFSSQEALRSIELLTMLLTEKDESVEEDGSEIDKSNMGDEFEAGIECLEQAWEHFKSYKCQIDNAIKHELLKIELENKVVNWDEPLTGIGNSNYKDIAHFILNGKG